MGKRSDFQRRPRDLYPTPYKAVLPLLPHLMPGWNFCEPCAGEGDLVRHLEAHGHTCVAQSDITEGVDAASLNIDFDGKYYFITNPPWPVPGGNGSPTCEIALNLAKQAPTWLLLSADFMHNRYFQQSGLALRCVKIVSVGRVSWMENGVAGKDNCAWYKFEEYQKYHGRIQFIPRMETAA